MTIESYPYQLEPIHQSVGDEKQSALEMLNLVSSSIERAWMSSDKKKEKLAQIEALRMQIHAVDDCKLNMMMENSVSSKCVPGMGFFSQRSVRKEITQQLATALNVLQQQNMSIRSSIRSDECTAGDHIEITLMDDLSIADDENTLQSDTNVSIGPDVKALNDEDTDPLNTSFGSNETGISDGSDDVVVTTSCLTSEATGPLGVSITTWHRKKVANEESNLGEQKDKENEDGESTDEENLEAKENEKYNKSLEEISVSFGPSLTIRATTRTKSVRFADLKPTTEDNIQRARELLKNAKRAKMKRDSMCKFQPIEENKTEE
ncbi:predicted protein [Chaetoceros tenuissimus]|uniref:Uncharacterized protein n=1 Tax=Chaetoceros tenuissimus TaxID=426638 RepID=A0AAD3CR16_9STRA|nr:predicted protein [Chaetoceros tenuissimus]